MTTGDIGRGSKPRRRIGIAGVVLTAMTLACVATAEVGSGTRAAPTTVRVTGDAAVAVEPDLATLRLSVVSLAKTSERAAADNAKRMRAVHEALRSLLGNDLDLRTEGFSLQPQYDHRTPAADGEGPVLRGYRVSNSVVVHVPDLERVGAAVDAAIASGANQVQSLEFGLADDREARARALEAATRRARAKADVVATALGGTVARVVSVEEGGATVMPRFRQTMMQAEMAPPVEAGSIEIRASVTLIAALRDQDN